MRGSVWCRPTVAEVAKQFVSRSKHGRTVGAGPAVGRRQVHVTSDGIAEAPERDFAECLGHGIGKLALCRDRDGLSAGFCLVWLIT